MRTVGHPGRCLVQRKGSGRKPPGTWYPRSCTGSRDELCLFPLCFHWPQGSPVSTLTAKSVCWLSPVLTSPASQALGRALFAGLPLTSGAALPPRVPPSLGRRLVVSGKATCLRSYTRRNVQSCKDVKRVCPKAKVPSITSVVTRPRSLLAPVQQWLLETPLGPRPNAPLANRPETCPALVAKGRRRQLAKDRKQDLRGPAVGVRVLCVTHGSAPAPPAETDPVFSSETSPRWGALGRQS